MLSSPPSLRPPPLTMISPSTRTFSRVTLPSSTPAVMYRLPPTTVLRRVTPDSVMVTLPQVEPSSCTPASCTGVPMARVIRMAASPRVMGFLGRKLPSS